MGDPLHDDEGLPAPTRGRRSTALALLDPDVAPPPPDGAVLHPPVVPEPAARKWFFAQIADEVRLAARMYFDSRYRVSRTFQILVPAVVALFALNYFLFAVWFAFPVVSPVLERVGCVVLGVLLYKLLTRELARYRDVLDYLARYARLRRARIRRFEFRVPRTRLAPPDSLPTTTRHPNRETSVIRLGVNIDHVATVRQAPPRAKEPDPVAAAVLATLGGADGITVHLREDRRHIQDRDVYLLRETVTTRLNLELATSDEILAIALKVRPDEATLVPEKRQELTTEGGLDVVATEARTRPAVERLKDAGIHVALFIDPDRDQVDQAMNLGADAIEFQTASYSEAVGEAVAVELDKLRAAAAHAVGLGLHVHLGHGLNYTNVKPVVRIPGVAELNIGHAIVSRAVFVGLERAVREMKQAMQEHYPDRRK